MDRMVPLIQQIAVAAVNSKKPVEINFGLVTNQTPLEITIYQKEVIEEQNMVFAKSISQDSGLLLGEVAIMLRVQGGKKFVVFDRLGYQALMSDGAPSELPTQEVEWLSALIYYEANSMPPKCQELVAVVALNRVKSPLFPETNTLEAVLKARGQYGYGVRGATATKIFDPNVDWRKEPYATPAVIEACASAARKAANGESRDDDGSPWPSNLLYQHSLYHSAGGVFFRKFTDSTGLWFMIFETIGRPVIGG